MAIAADPASTAAASSEAVGSDGAPPGYRAAGPRPERLELALPVLAYLCLVFGACFATCHQLSMATASAYLEPVRPGAANGVAWLCVAAAGIGAFFGRSPRALVLGLIATSLLASLAVPVVYFAFEAGTEVGALVTLGAVAGGVCAGVTVAAALRALGNAARQLDAVGLALRPFPLLAALLFGTGAVAAFGFVGPWRTTAVLALLLCALAGWTPKLLAYVGSPLQQGRAIRICALASAGLGLVSLASAERFLPSTSLAAATNTLSYRTAGVHHEITVTSGQRAFELYEGGRLRVSTIDSHRYYEALVAPALAAAAAPKQVLILGGGTGLAELQALRHPGVQRITTVCPEPALVRVASSLRFLRERNEDALASPKLQVVYDEPARYAQDAAARFDVIIVDAPDPMHFADGASYSVHFYTRLRRLLTPGGVLAAQATSPFSAPRTFAIAERSMQAAGFATTPYRAAVPTFGDWGFLLAQVGSTPVVPWDTLSARLQATRSDGLRAFPIDSVARGPTAPSYLFDGHIVEVFAEERAHRGL